MEAAKIGPPKSRRGVKLGLIRWDGGFFRDPINRQQNGRAFSKGIFSERLSKLTKALISWRGWYLEGWGGAPLKFP